MGRLLNCETWGCELFSYRAENAATRMDKCHSAALESTTKEERQDLVHIMIQEVGVDVEIKRFLWVRVNPDY